MTSTITRNSKRSSHGSPGHWIPPSGCAIKGFDDVAAARVLDAALARKEPAAPIELARALAARAELAVALGDIERAQTLKPEIAKVSLKGKDGERFHEELHAAEALEVLLGLREPQ